ncbi:MAG: oligosaccharide flippase family protein [Sphingobacteriaceae bacterium]
MILEINMAIQSKIKGIISLFARKDNKNASIALIGNLLFSILGFISIAILARSLSITDFGSWTIYLTAATLIEMMRSGFLHTALIKFCSGNSLSEQKKYIASGWLLGISFTLIISLLLLGLNLIFNINNTPYALFLKLYPLLSLASLPFSISTSLLQFKMQFGKMVLLKTMNMILTLIVFASTFFIKINTEQLITLHIMSNAITSIISISLKWSGVEYIKHVSTNKIKEISHFGKYTFGTLIGTNLLKSSDTFIIGATLGSDKAALYAIPLKLTEVFEILLRSFVSVALPKMSASFSNNKIKETQNTFQEYSGLLSILYIPIMIICFSLAEFIVQLFGGNNYSGIADVFRIFCFYGLLLPIDRFTGVTLDVINLPRYNFYKVFIMVTFNITFDLIVLQFTNDLKFIALGTVLTAALGIATGIIYLNKTIHTKIKVILYSGIKTIRAYKAEFH